MTRRPRVWRFLGLAWLAGLGLGSAAPVEVVVSPAGPVPNLEAARDQVRRLKAAGGLTAPVNVILRAGIYTLTAPFQLDPRDSGTEACPVTYTAAPGERAVISGGRRVGGWRQTGDGVWTTEVPEARAGTWTFRQLWVNGQRRTLARSPNTGYFRIVGKAGPAVDPGTGNPVDASKRAFRFHPGDLKPWPRLQTVDVRVFYHWETAMLRLASVDEPTHTVTFTGEMKWPFWGRQRYFVENTLDAFDAPGEWYLDSATGLLYYRPLPGEDMATAEVVAPVLNQLVLLRGEPDSGSYVEHVAFRGLAFHFADYTLEPEGHGDWQAAVTVPATLEASGTRFCTIEGCEIGHLGQYGVWFARGCTDNRIVQNEIFDLGAGGVRIGTDGIGTGPGETTRNEVSNNFIHDAGHAFPGAVGVWIGQSSHNTIAHNEVCDLNYTAISCGWTWGYGPSGAHHNAIEYNYLHHVGQGMLCDMGAIYTLGIAPGTRVANNLIHDVWDWEEGYGAGGIYPDEGSSQIVIENNVVYRTATGGLTVHYGKDNVARNNVFAFGRDLQVYFGRSDKDSSITFERNLVYYSEGDLLVRESTLAIDHNLYFRTDGQPITFLGDRDWAQWQALGRDTHSLLADPKFRDPEHFDFRLQPDSPALGLGFQPIDMSTVGLTGPEAWVRRPRAIQRPVTPVPRRAAAPPLFLDDGFEDTPVGAAADAAYTHGETGAATIRVTDQAAASGRYSLKFTDAPGLDQIWNPHLYYSPHLGGDVVAESSFDLRLEPGAVVWVEWRDAANPYRVGPSLGVDAEGMLKAGDRELVKVPAGQWVHFQIACGLGKKANATYDLAVTLPGEAPKPFPGLPCNPAFRQLEWFGFVSNANQTAVFYLDNLKLNLRKP